APLVAAKVNESLCVKILIEHADHAVGDDLASRAVFVLLERARIRFSLHPILSHLQRLEERAEPEIVALRDRIVLVVVAVRAVEGEAEKRLSRVLNSVAHPLVRVKRIPVSDQ